MVPRCAGFGLVLLVASLVDHPVHAEPLPLPARWASGTPWRLELAEVLRLAAEQNLGIVLARETALVADLGVELSLGAFEPTVNASYRHADAESPPATSQEGVPGTTVKFVHDGWRVGASQRLGTGTTLALALDEGRSKSTAGTAVQPLNYRATVSATLTQPILRGFSFDAVIPRVEVLRARIGSERQRHELEISLTGALFAAETAYWGVVGALERHRVVEDALERASAQVELTKRQIDAGLLAPSDLTDAESTLAERRLTVVRSEATIEESWDRLRKLLNLPRAEWGRAIQPTERPRFTPRALSAEASLDVALQHRPEVKQLDLDRRRETLDVRKADNDRLPQVDLGATYALTGQDTTHGGAVDGLAEAHGPSWEVFVSLSWTPLQRATAAAAEIARAQRRITEVTRAQRLLDLHAEVREAVRNVETAVREVEAAGAFRTRATTSLDTEQRKFLAGTSSNFIVGQRQEGLAQAELAELDAILRHRQATLALEAATGVLVDARGIRLDVTRGAAPRPGPAARP